MVYLYGISLEPKMQQVGLGLTYLYPYDYNLTTIDENVGQRIHDFILSECSAVEWAKEQHQIYKSIINVEANVQEHLGIYALKFNDLVLYI